MLNSFSKHEDGRFFFLILKRLAVREGWKMVGRLAIV